MTLLDHVTIPTSLPEPYSGNVRVTVQERRDQAVRAAGLSTQTCPTCGHAAWLDVVTIHHAGQAPVTRTYLRCNRAANRDVHGSLVLTGKCPVHLVSETPVDAPDLPADIPEEVTVSKPRTCADCGADISNRGPRTSWCKPCSVEHKKARQRAWHHRSVSGQTGGGLDSDAPAPASPLVSAESAFAGSGGRTTPEPLLPPLALRVSVLDLAQRIVEGAGLLDLVRGILSLSPERQGLLQRILQDEDVPA